MDTITSPLDDSVIFSFKYIKKPVNTLLIWSESNMFNFNTDCLYIDCNDCILKNKNFSCYPTSKELQILFPQLTKTNPELFI